MRFTRFLVLHTLCLFLTQASLVYGDTEVIEWPERIGKRIRSEVTNLQLELSNAIFDSFSQVEFNEDFGGILNLGLKNRRAIFNNRDVLGTYTVLDFDQIQISKGHGLSSVFSNFLKSALDLAFGFSFGASLQLPIVNLRVVAATESRKLLPSPILDDIVGDPRLADDQMSGAEIIELEALPKDPRFKPRFGRLLRRITFPFFAPLSLARIQKMPHGEIFSYSAKTNVNAGGSIALSPLAIPGKLGSGVLLSGGNVEIKALELTAGMSGSVEASVSVFKETDRYIRTKISRRYVVSVGTQVNLGRMRVLVLDASSLEILGHEWMTPLLSG